MPKHRIYYLLALYFVTHIGYLAALLLGPTVHHREIVNFGQDLNLVHAHKLSIHVGNFNFLNDFVTLDLILIRNTAGVPSSPSISNSVLVKAHKGSRVETIFANQLTPVTVLFNPNSVFSEPLRLYSRAVVDFVRLDIDLIVKFSEGECFPGLAVVSYIDTAHALIELVVRLIFFFIAVTVFVSLVPIRKDKTTSPFQLKILTILMGLIVIASNPLIVLSYFTDSVFLPLVDAAAGLALVITTSAGLLLISEVSHLKTVQSSWIWVTSAPFLVAGVLYFLNSFLSQVYGLTSATSILMRILAYGRSAISAICFLRLIVSLIAFKSEVQLERMVVITLALVAFGVGMICELFLVDEPLIASSHEVQIFTFASVSTFVLFLTKLYWPVNGEKFVEPDVGEEPA